MSDLTTHETIELINALFDRIKEQHQLRSDAALARHMGVHDMNIMRWRRGEFGTSLKVLAPLLVEHSNAIKRTEIAA